jgi:hypothetical protein
LPFFFFATLDRRLMRHARFGQLKRPCDSHAATSRASRRTTINTGSRQRPLILREDVEALVLEKAEGAQAVNLLLLVNRKSA